MVDVEYERDRAEMLLNRAYMALDDLMRAWGRSDKLPDDSAYSQWDMDGEAEVKYSSEGLEIRLWAERGDDSLHGSIKAPGCKIIQADLCDEYNDAEERLVPMLFWELYKQIKGM